MSKLLNFEYEIEQTENYCLEGSTVMFKTEAEYRAYVAGIQYCLTAIKQFNETVASDWEITFMDGRKEVISGGDILSVIGQIPEYEEIVKFECLPES